MEAGQEVADGLTANATQSTAELNTHAGDPNAHHMPGMTGRGFHHRGACLTKIPPLSLMTCLPFWDASDGAE